MPASLEFSGRFNTSVQALNVCLCVRRGRSEILLHISFSYNMDILKTEGISDLYLEN